MSTGNDVCSEEMITVAVSDVDCGKMLVRDCGGEPIKEGVSLSSGCRSINKDCRVFSRDEGE